jgi:hypothetical protein
MLKLSSSPEKESRYRSGNGSSGIAIWRPRPGIGAEEVIATVASRPAPMMSASAGLEL